MHEGIQYLASKGYDVNATIDPRYCACKRAHELTNRAEEKQD